MKLTQQQIKDLLILTYHARADMGYGAEGTYTNYDNSEADEKEIKMGKRALSLIEKIMATAIVELAKNKND